VALRDVDPDLEHSPKLGVSHGALVQDVTAGSPGDRAGLLPQTSSCRSTMRTSSTTIN
jgi:S1-C subfamily serine protease